MQAEADLKEYAERRKDKGKQDADDVQGASPEKVQPGNAASAGKFTPKGRP